MYWLDWAGLGLALACVILTVIVLRVEGVATKGD